MTRRDRSDPGIIARDYVEGMWKMLQQDVAEDFVLATGETHPVKEYVEKAFAVVNTKIRFGFQSLSI
jgi:GDPmannose 4,6-dehydratase